MERISTPMVTTCSTRERVLRPHQLNIRKQQLMTTTTMARDSSTTAVVQKSVRSVVYCT